MIDNAFYNDILDDLKGCLVQDEKQQWCLEITHYSGHYADWKPIQYLDDDEIADLEDSVFDDFEFEHDEDEYDWEDFHEAFETLFYSLVDENLGN